MPAAAFTNSTVGDHTHDYDDIYYVEHNCSGGGQGWYGSNSTDTDNSPCFTRRSTLAAGAHTHSISGGDSETRPANANVNWIIKF